MRSSFGVRPAELLAPRASRDRRCVEESDARRPKMVGVLLGPWPAITNRVLTVERNRLLIAFALLLAVNLALETTFHYRLPWEKYGGYGGLLLAAAKLVYTYMIYRLSRVLRQPVWMTALYVVLAPIAGFELIPLVGLLVGVRVARGALDELRS